MQLQDPKTHEQLIQKLKEKKVVITDDKVANRLINLVNYYRLKGYLLPYTVKGKKECFKPIPVEQLEAIYEFDSDLRNLVSNSVEDIEVYLRDAISYYHAHKFGSDGYLNSQNYNKDHNHIIFVKKIEQCLK